MVPLAGDDIESENRRFLYFVFFFSIFISSYKEGEEERMNE
jgi:hypothetical protein